MYYAFGKRVFDFTHWTLCSVVGQLSLEMDLTEIKNKMTTINN